jgi:hypothetical protein
MHHIKTVTTKCFSRNIESVLEIDMVKSLISLLGLGVFADIIPKIVYCILHYDRTCHLLLE